MKSRRLLGDTGLTLIELMFSIAILGFILAAVTAAMSVVLLTASPTKSRVAVSHDEQIINAFLGSDIRRSAPRLVTGGAPDLEVLPVTTTKPACIAEQASTANSGLVALTWQDSAGFSPTTNNYVWYYVAAPKLPSGLVDTTKPAQLRRATCSVSTDFHSADGAVIARTDKVIAYNVNGTALVAQPVTCTPATSCSAVATCTSLSSCSPAQRVALELPLGTPDPLVFKVQADRVACLSSGECPRMTLAGP